MNVEKKTLREWRELKGYTTKFVANQLGVSPLTLTAKERGDIDFTAAQVNRLCELYRVTLDEVFYLPTDTTKM